MSSELLTANIFHLYIEDDDSNQSLVGALSDVTFEVDGDEVIFGATGTDFIVGNTVSRKKIRISATLGYLNESFLKYVGGKYKDSNTDTEVYTFSITNNTLSSPVNEDYIKRVSFTLIGKFNNSDGEKEIVIRNVVLTKYRLTIRNGEFWLQDIDGVGRMLEEPNASSTSQNTQTQE